jgi:hypothetical protein
MILLKNLKDFLSSRKPESTVSFKEEVVIEPTVLTATEEAVCEDGGMLSVHHLPLDPPNVLIMRRKSVRQFPNGQRVALYYVDKIDKYVTVPYTAMQWSASTPEEFESEGEVIEESIMQHLKSVVDGKTSKAYKFKNGKTMKFDRQTANAVLKVHGALNDENKQKVSDMAQKSKEHFGKVVDFAWKHLK